LPPRPIDSRESFAHTEAMPTRAKRGEVILTARVMREWPLPLPAEGGDKEKRGRVLIVGGAPEMPGAAILAATAALRAGAGKLRIATCRSIAPFVAIAVPEARVFALPETRSGSIAASAAAQVAEAPDEVDAAVFGPGLVGEAAVEKLMKNVLPRLSRPIIVLDAAALAFLKDAPHGLGEAGAAAILTPHAGEMASLLGADKEEITRDPAAFARLAADRFKAVVSLKGEETHTATPRGETYVNRAGNVGLATSGSGDTLSGIIAGLAARGAEPHQAAAWATYLHGRAGERLAKKVGPLGFLARELLGEIPPLMAEMARAPRRGSRAGR
jgi:ADP-dependent NAD(P)H-hydrate dehydratase